MQTADCTPDTKCRLQTAEWAQNTDWESVEFFRLACDNMSSSSYRASRNRFSAISNKNQLWPNSLFALKGSFLFFTLSSHWLLVIFPPYDWLFYVVWVCFYITQLKSILFVGFFALLHSPLLYSTFLLCALPSSLFTLLALLHSMLCKRKRMPFTLPNPIRSKT